MEANSKSKDLTSSQTWTMIDDPEGKVATEINLTDINKYNDEETILYNQETRQTLLSDLEECYYFMK